MKHIQTRHMAANGKYFGPWCIENGVLEYIGPLEHYLHETKCGDLKIYTTKPILDKYNKIQFHENGVIIRNYKLILISYDKGISWKSLID